MTWGRALPILAVCVVFDGLRLFFEFFWIIGPALATAACTAAGSSFIGTKIAATACGVGGGALAYFGAVPLEMFGTIMAMAVGVFGWLTILVAQLLNNAGIFKENFSILIKYGVGFIVSEIPIIGALPALTFVNATMFHIQIKKGKEELKKYEKENKERKLQERREQAAELMRARTAQIDEMATIQEAQYAQAMDSEEIPEGMREAA